MLRAHLSRYTLNFKAPAITSRERLLAKDTYFVQVYDDRRPDVVGVGECALFKGLSSDDIPEYESILKHYCDTICDLDVSGVPYSSMRMGLETALLDLHNGGERVLYDTPWSRGECSMTINGLVWMGDMEQMYSRMLEKLNKGFCCIKFKVGGIDWDREVRLIEYIRERHDADEVEIRLDANGNFSNGQALDRLRQLARYHIHSIEQPIRQGQPDEMARLCAESPVPIALDEELIGMYDAYAQRKLLETIRPAYVILKPSLCGGLANTATWIDTARSMGIGWWVTSALESNVGLNAIAQFVSQYSPRIPQGLGTGQLYTNNIDAPLTLDGDKLKYDKSGIWGRIP